MKKIFNNKIINCVFSIIEWIICITLVVLIILTGFQRFSNQGNFFGYRIYTVASGSMIPTYNIGDTLLIKETDATEINVGDAVTYLGSRAGVDGMIITHQVVGVEKDENGKLSFHTKGIANNIEDPIVSEEQVLGKVVHKFFFLSILGKVTTNMTYLLVFITIPMAILIAIEIIKIVYKKDEDEEIPLKKDETKEESSLDEENDEVVTSIEDDNDTQEVEVSLEEETEEDNTEIEEENK